MSSSSRPPARKLPSDPTGEDPFETGLCDEALAGFQKLLPPDVLAAMRARLVDAYVAHPTGRRLVRQASPDPARVRSGDVERHRDGAAPDETERTKKKGAG